MAITQALTTSFKTQLFTGQHNFSAAGGHTFKIALFLSAASLDATTTDYTATNESSGTNYTAGGQVLTNVEPTSTGTTAFVDFADETFTNVTLTARGALIYNTTTNGGTGTTDAVAVLDFGIDKSAAAGDFTIQFPVADASNAIIRLT